MLADDNPLTTGMALVRATTRAVPACLADGWSIDRIRSELLPRALEGFNIDGVDPGHPTLVSGRSALVRAVERAMAESHTRPPGV